MPLTASEIRVGAVAYFDVENLHENPEVTFSGDRVTRDSKGNQFVCYNVDGDQSF
jgi:hypothetical protein